MIHDSVRRYRYAAVLLGGALALAAMSCRPQDLKPTESSELLATVQLSTNRVHVGDEFALNLDIRHPPGGHLELPVLDRGAELGVRKQETLKSSQPGHTRYRYRLTSFAVTNHIVSTNSIRFIAADGRTLETPFPFATFEVVSLLTGTNTQPREMKGLVDWPARHRRLWMMLGLVTGLAALAGLAALLLARRRNGAPPAPPPPPHDIALRAMDALRARGYIEREDVEPFFVELSAIVRAYIEMRFGLRAPEQTTEEFIREATSSRLLSLDHQHLTMAFLEQCDLVKFARHRPGAPVMQAALEAAERLVRETIPPPPTLPS